LKIKRIVLKPQSELLVVAVPPMADRPAYFFSVPDINRDTSDCSVEVNEMFVVHLCLKRVPKNS